VAGVSTYWMELFAAQPQLDLVLVPIGQGSGMCGAVAARNALGLKTRIVGVVSAHALAYKLSFEAGRKIERRCRPASPMAWPAAYRTRRRWR
jgi:threonine dehydratase